MEIMNIHTAGYNKTDLFNLLIISSLSSSVSSSLFTRVPLIDPIDLETVITRDAIRN